MPVACRLVKINPVKDLGLLTVQHDPVLGGPAFQRTAPSSATRSTSCGANEYRH